MFFEPEEVRELCSWDYFHRVRTVLFGTANTRADIWPGRTVRGHVRPRSGHARAKSVSRMKGFGVECGRSSEVLAVRGGFHAEWIDPSLAKGIRIRWIAV